MVNIDRHWARVITELNDYAQKLHLDNVLIIRRKDEDGNDIVYVNQKVYPLQDQIPPYIGYVLTPEGETATPLDLDKLRDEIKIFLDGAAYVLKLNHFHAEAGPDNSKNFRRLAQGFETIYNSAEVNDTERVNNFLLKHLNFVFPLEQALNQVQSKLKRRIQSKIEIVRTYSIQSGPGKDLIDLRMYLQSEEEVALFEEFVNEWWFKTVDPKEEEMMLSYKKEWEKDSDLTYVSRFKSAEEVAKAEQAEKDEQSNP